MHRREFVTTAAAAALGAVALPSSKAAAPKSKRPNLIYVFADQLRLASCGYAGDTFAQTPNIDAFAAQGCDFHQAISSTPVCAPYRASLMTGKYQSSTGMVINEIRLSPEHETFGKCLKNGGYQTAYIGKWHMWANQLGHHDLVKNGFVPPGPYRFGFDDYWEAYNFNHDYVRAPYFLDDPTPHHHEQFEPTAQTDSAIRYLQHAKGSEAPFALFLSYGPPHDPWTLKNSAPEFYEKFRNVNLPLRPNYTTVQDPYADTWQKMPADYDTVVHEWMRIYYGMAANIDWNFGRLLKALEASGLAEDTVVVFTSDHGEMFGSHGRRAKLIFYEEAARIPFLVRWPKKVPAHTKSEALLGTPDIMPTLLSMLKIPVPSAVEGKDLSSHAFGKVGSAKTAAHMQGMGATAAWQDGTEWRAVRDHEYTYAIYHRDRKELLFHNQNDPYQMRDLAADKSSAATLAHYRQMSEAWRREQNDTFENCSWYESRWTTDRNITNTAKGVGQNLDALQSIVSKWLPPGIGDKSVHASHEAA